MTALLEQWHWWNSCLACLAELLVWIACISIMYIPYIPPPCLSDHGPKQPMMSHDELLFLPFFLRFWMIWDPGESDQGLTIQECGLKLFGEVQSLCRGVKENRWLLRSIHTAVALHQLIISSYIQFQVPSHLIYWVYNPNIEISRTMTIFQWPLGCPLGCKDWYTPDLNSHCSTIPHWYIGYGMSLSGGVVEGPFLVRRGDFYYLCLCARKHGDWMGFQYGNHVG